MSGYDINIMKKNIKKKMKEMNITQSQLSQETGISQPTISKVLSEKDSSSFSVNQLVDIANYLGSSVDNLLGIEPGIQKNEQSISDIFNLLLTIDNIAEIKISECDTDEITYSDNFSPAEYRKSLCIYWDIPKLCDILQQWKDLKLSNIPNSTKFQMLDLWKQNTLKEYQDCLKSRDFQSKQENGRRLYDLLMNDYDEWCSFQTPEYQSEFMESTWDLLDILSIKDFVGDGPLDTEEYRDAVSLACKSNGLPPL